MTTLGKRPREETAEETAAAEKGPKAVAVSDPAPGSSPSGPEFSMELLKFYYEQMYPYNHMVAWMSYGCDPKALKDDEEIKGKYMRQREICFTLKDDIYVRYTSYPTLGQFKSELKKRCPIKIDLGAIYNHEPKKKSTCTDFAAEEKELVFDIDITDYDDVRDCCSGGAVCNECWPLMNCAIEVLELALRDYFGLQNRLWVFSGRRGIHCWVCDPGVTKYDGRIRTAIIKFLHTYTGNDRSNIKVDLAKPFNNRLPVSLHTFYTKALEICEKYFRDHVCGRMDLFFKDRPAGEESKTPGGPEKKETLSFRDTMFMMLRMPMDDIKELHQSCAQLIQKGRISNSLELWDAVVEGLGRWQRAERSRNGGKGRVKLNDGTEIERDGTNQGAQLARLVAANKAEIIFAHVFPRVDVEVTKGVNHLLKAPFCVHPKTGKLCVPMDVQEPGGGKTLTEKLAEFDPTRQPTLRTLHEELIEHGSVEKTAVGAAVQIFETAFLNGLRNSYNSEYNDVEDLQKYLDGVPPHKTRAQGGNGGVPMTS